MKKKTINTVVCKKFDELLASISDEQVRELIKTNTIITGGSITSMLLKEDVNDFDLYFTNKETVLAVAHYYVSKFKESTVQKHNNGDDILIKVLDGDHPDGDDWAQIGGPEKGRVKIYLKSSGIAGESGTEDYQYFESRPPEEGEEFIDNIISNVSEVDEIHPAEVEVKPKYRPIFLSANAITLSDKVQIIIRFYGEPKEIHDNYDYVHCTNYWYSKTREVVLNQQALEAILSKELIYIGSKYPLCSIIRTRKFLKRGWTINAGQYLKMCFQVSKLDLTNIAVLEDQLIGVDVAYFAQLIDAVKNHSGKEKKDGKEFKIDYGYLATIIDKMF